MTIGLPDVFERMYMQKFRELAGQFGEFVEYERDRGARDIGLHLSHKMEDGSERLSSSLCWFQMKGLMSTTLSKEEFEGLEEVKIPLRVNHLQFWYLQPMPTYLALYVKSVDEFLVLNLQKFIQEEWENGVLSLKAETATVSVPCGSVLDKSAFKLILRNGDIEEWSRILQQRDKDQLYLFTRDYEVIYNLGIEEDQKIVHRMVYWDWQSKIRGQVFIQRRVGSEKPDWEDLREHWQSSLHISELESVFPYLEFLPDPDLDVPEDELEYYEEYLIEDEHVSIHQFSNGTRVYGYNRSDEFIEYTMGIRLTRLDYR